MPDKLPALKITINGQVISLPLEQARQTIWGLIPLWMKDSTVAPPEPEGGAPLGMSTSVLMVARSTIKNMARPFLGPLHQWMYGQPLNIGRKDSMPILIQLMIDFVLMQAMSHDIELGTNDEGTIETVRSSKRTLEAVDTAPVRSEGSA